MDHPLICSHTEQIFLACKLWSNSLKPLDENSFNCIFLIFPFPCLNFESQHSGNKQTFLKIEIPLVLFPFHKFLLDQWICHAGGLDSTSVLYASHSNAFTQVSKWHFEFKVKNHPQSHQWHWEISNPSSLECQLLKIQVSTDHCRTMGLHTVLGRYVYRQFVIWIARLLVRLDLIYFNTRKHLVRRLKLDFINHKCLFWFLQ